MVNTNDKRKVGRPKKPPLTEEEEKQKRKDTNKRQREYYKKNIILNPTKVRAYTKYQNQIRKKTKINKRQTLLQTKQRNITKKSKEKIQGKNEK
tara:strand:- start:282 stop:563 length:282 start_codon:yes stop_codon:yes gene_type:complete